MQDNFFFFLIVCFCPFWYRHYYMHTPRDLVSPVCGIFIPLLNQWLNFVIHCPTSWHNLRVILTPAGYCEVCKISETTWMFKFPLPDKTLKTSGMSISPNIPSIIFKKFNQTWSYFYDYSWKFYLWCVYYRSIGNLFDSQAFPILTFVAIIEFTWAKDQRHLFILFVKRPQQWVELSLLCHI